MAENQATLILTAETQRFNQAMDASRAKVVDITSGISGRFRTMANEVTANTQQMQSGVSSHFERMGSAFTKVNGILIGFAGLLAGGAMFRAAVTETVELEKAAVKLGRTLGIGATEASVLQVALDDVYQDASQLEAGMQKLVKTLNDDEKAITRLGVATRDQNGNFRGQLDIMLDVNSKLSQFKEGTDRNVEGMKIYGKSWKEVEPLIALTRDRMEESRKKAHELGLVVGEENVQALSRYRAAMNDAGDVMTAIKKVIGDALMPVLTKLAEWWSTIGPAAVAVFKYAVGGLALAFQLLVTGVTTAWHTVNAAVNNIGASIIALGKAAGQAVEGDFEAAGKTLRAVPKTISGHWKDAFNEINKSANETRRLFDSLFGKQTATKGGAGGLNATSSDEDKAGATGGKKSGSSAKSQMGDFQESLEVQRKGWAEQALAQGTFYEMSKVEEREFWRDKLKLKSLSGDDQFEVSKKIFEIDRSLAKEAFAQRMAEMREEVGALRKDSEERVRISKEIAAAEAQKFGPNSPEARKAGKDAEKVELEVLLAASKRAIEMTKEGSEERYTIIAETAAKIRDSYGLETEAAQQAMEQVKSIGEQEADFRKTQAAKAADLEQQQAKAGLAIHEETIKQSLALGVISKAEELQALEDAKEKEFQIEKSNLERQMQIFSAEEKKFTELQNKLGELENRRLVEALAAQREISAVKRGYAEDSARAQIADLNAEIASLRSNSPGRVDRAEQALGVASASFPTGSKEQGDAAGVLAREEAQAERVSQQERIAASRSGAAERLIIAYEEAEKVRALVGEQDSAYEEAQNRLTQARAEFLSGETASAERQLDFAQQSALQKIELERQTLGQEAQLGEISAQEQIARMQFLAQQEYDIELEVLNQKYELYEQDMLKREEFGQRRIALERQHMGEMQQLSTETIKEQGRSIDEGLTPIAQGMSRMFNQMAEGALSWRKAVSQIGRSVRVELINYAVDIARNWMRTEILKTQGTVAGAAVRGAAEKQSAIMSVAQVAWAAIKIIGIKAWEAASAVYASIAAIPYIGPFLAPAMALGAAAVVVGYIGRIASAEGGYDIPAGVNPLVQTHAREMILPAQYADVIRGLAGDGGAAGGMMFSPTFNIQALDSRGVERVLKENMKPLAETMMKAYRDGYRSR